MINLFKSLFKKNRQPEAYKTFAEAVQKMAQESFVRHAPNYSPPMSFWPYNPKAKARILDVHDSHNADYFKRYTVTFRYNDTNYTSICYKKGDGVIYQIAYADTANYHGGRFCDFNESEGVIDFNYSANLLCAYSDTWDCSPPSIRLPMPIYAGQREYTGNRICFTGGTWRLCDHDEK